MIFDGIYFIPVGVYAIKPLLDAGDALSMRNSGKWE